MTTPNLHPDPAPDDERALWRAVAAAERPDPGLPEAEDERLLDLAAYAEGRLEGATRDAVEGWLADTPSARAALADLRHRHDSAEVSPAVLARAKALVPRTAEVHVHTGVLARIGRMGGWAVAAAAAFAVCVLGYHAGQGVAPGSVQASTPSSSLTADITFGAIDDDDDDTIEFMLFTASTDLLGEGAR